MTFLIIIFCLDKVGFDQTDMYAYQKAGNCTMECVDVMSGHIHNLNRNSNCLVTGFYWESWLCFFR